MTYPLDKLGIQRTLPRSPARSFSNVAKPWLAIGKAIFVSVLAFLTCNFTFCLTSIAAAEPTSIDPNQLVLQAVQRAVWGPSISCQLRQSTFMGDHELLAEGEYWQMGQGTGQMKMTLELSANKGAARTSWIQISDGKLLWTSTGSREPIRRIYLNKIRDSLGGIARDPNAHPEVALYMAIGGQPEVLRCLYVRYRWYKIFTGLDDRGREVWQLFGTLRTGMPTPVSITPVDSLLSVDKPSPEVPTEVRLTLGRDEKSLLFPYKIDYYRREKGEEGLPAKRLLVSTVEYDEVVSPISPARDFFQFQVPDAADQIVDETNEYMPSYPQANAGTATRR